MRRAGSEARWLLEFVGHTDLQIEGVTGRRKKRDSDVIPRIEDAPEVRLTKKKPRLNGVFLRERERESG